VDYLCYFTERWSCATTLIGGLVNGYYVAPYVYPGFGSSYMICTEVSMSPLGSSAGFPGVSQLKATFGKPECANPSSTSPQEIAELSIELSGQGMPIPNAGMIWGSDAPSGFAGQALGDGTIQPFAILAEGTYSIRMKYCTSINFSGIKSYIGCINSGSTTLGSDTFSTGTLLFIGYTARQTITTQGAMQVEREYKFAIQCALSSWNLLVDPKDGFTATPTDKNGNPMYRQVDFSALFSGT
jgi:hypothetical protein